jgi:hypothetical protein
MCRLVRGSFSSSGPGLSQDRRGEPECEVRPEQVETDPAIWPSRSAGPLE